MVLGKRYFVRCKVHKYQFDLTSGVVREGVCPPLQVYRTRIRQDDAQSAIVEAMDGPASRMGFDVDVDLSTRRLARA